MTALSDLAALIFCAAIMVLTLAFARNWPPVTYQQPQPPKAITISTLEKHEPKQVTKDATK